MMNILVLAQTLPQWYADVLTNSFLPGTNIEFLTGSQITNNTIACPACNTKNHFTAMLCRTKYYYFVKHWADENAVKKYDLMIALSDPPLNAFLLTKLKKLFGCKIVYISRALFPQLPESKSSNLLIKQICKIWNKKNQSCLPQIDRVVTVGNNMAKQMEHSMLGKLTVTVIPEAVDSSSIQPIQHSANPFSIANGINNKFVVLYRGTFHTADSVHIILEAARLLKNHTNIAFVLIGNDAKTDAVKKAITEEKLENVHLFPAQTGESAVYSMLCGDVSIILQSKKSADFYLPHQAYDSMCAAMALIGITPQDSDLANLITENDIGFLVSDNNAETLKNKILEFYNNSDKLITTKTKARSCAVESYDIPVISKKYHALFTSMDL